MAEIEKKTKRYPTDLTDEEWARIEPFLPGAAKSGRPARTDLREVLNAIRYLARSGGGWRMLPKDFPPWPTVYWWFRRFVRRFLFQTIHDVALMLDRERVGREASPTGGVIHHRNHQTVRYRAGLRSPSTPLGRRAHLRMDDPVAPARAGLRGAHRLLPGHDPCRPRKYPPQTHRSPIDVLKRTLS
jgi:transposase